MTTVEMTDIRTTLTKEASFGRSKKIKLKIPGGWNAHVPVVQPDAETMQRLSAYWQADGHPPRIAQRMALETIRKRYIQCHVKQLRESLRRYARRYAERFPHLIRDDGTLAGFDPAKMQTAYVPGENTGRSGKAFVDEFFAEMREEGENEQRAA